MDTTLWLVQWLTALGFLFAGAMKLLRSKADLAGQMPWVRHFSAPQVKAIGLAELAGAAGLVGPGLAGTLPWLTPLAAGGLTVLMAGAVATHVRINDVPARAIPAAINLALCLMVAIGRW